MANKMVANIKSLTTGVDELTKKINGLYSALEKVNTVASKTLKSASGIVNETGGSYNLTKATTRPGTGADNAKFVSLAQTQIQQGGNLLANALGGFSYASTSTMVASGAVNGFGNVVGGSMSMIPGLSQTMTNAYGYYQAALKSPGVNRAQLERATMGAMNKGLSSVGSASQVAAILGSMGYTPGSSNYLQVARQVGGAYNYLGMNNAAAAQAIAGFQTGPMGANLFQYGITTMNANGTEKTTGQLAKELMGYMTGGQKVTAADVRSSYQKGALGANLANMGFSADQQSILYQAMIDIASGGSGDLSKAKSVKGNANTFLTAQGRINATTTQTMESAEAAMIKGFENAADTVEAFNKVVRHASSALGYATGYTQGVGGSQAGKGGVQALGGLLQAGGAALSFVAPEIGVPLMLAGTAVANTGKGGGTTGYGAAFGVSNRGRIGGSSPAQGAAISAGYGAKSNSGIWAGTNGAHTGLDYEMPVGTPVKSAYDGVVTQVDLNSDYGTSIMVDNANGTQAIYGHLSEKSVKVGDAVKQGQRIGKSGKSGNANGPHLHFEIRDGKNHPVDPTSYLSGTGYAASLFANYARTNPTGYDLVGETSTASTSTGALSNYSPSKGALSDAALRDVLTAAGFYGSSLDTAMAVVRAESGGVAGRHSDPSLKADDSYGLFQINMLGEMGARRNANYLKQYGKYGYTGPESLYDPGINARIAYDISKGGTKWSDAWFNTSKKLGIGGGTTGYGAAFGNTEVTSGNKTVNVTLKIERASEQEAMQFAKKVKYYLEHDNETTEIGRA